MRIKINFEAQDNPAIPIEYNYHIYLNLRKILFGYLKNAKPKMYTKYKKDFPCFTYSQLMIPKRELNLGFITIQSNFFSIFISSIDQIFIEYLIKSLNQEKAIRLFNRNFPLKKIEIIEDITFSSAMKFRMLSPLLLYTIIGDRVHFLKPDDREVNSVFRQVLIKRYDAEMSEARKSDNISFVLDQNYLEQKNRATKLLTIRNINYRTIFAPFKIEGDPELIRFAYEAGIGYKTNYGFGMIDVL